MTPDQMYRMTFRQFFNKLKGFQEIREIDSYERWDIARTEAAMIINVWVKKQVKPDDLLQLNRDRGNTREPTEEGLKKFKEKFGDKV